MKKIALLFLLSLHAEATYVKAKSPTVQRFTTGTGATYTTPAVLNGFVLLP